MVNNIDSIYANIWGQCADPLNNTIKHLDKFTVKHKVKDVIWILKNRKTVSTLIDSIGNKRVNYFNTLKYSVNMRQGPLEGGNKYIKQARSEIDNLSWRASCVVQSKNHGIGGSSESIKERNNK